VTDDFGLKIGIEGG